MSFYIQTEVNIRFDEKSRTFLYFTNRPYVYLCNVAPGMYKLVPVHNRPAVEV